jgi:hypothetical protein
MHTENQRPEPRKLVLTFLSRTDDLGVEPVPTNLRPLYIESSGASLFHLYYNPLI